MEVLLVPPLALDSTLGSSSVTAGSSSTVCNCVSSSSEVARAESVPRTRECDNKLALMVETEEWNLGRLVLVRTGETKGTPEMVEGGGNRVFIVLGVRVSGFDLGCYLIGKWTTMRRWNGR